MTSRKLSRVFLITSLGVLASSGIYSLYHYVLFAEQMVRALL